MQTLPVWSGAALTGPPRGDVLPAASVRRILTLHLNNLGDLLFTLPALAALRAAFPHARVTSVVRPPLAPLLRDSGLADDILLRPRQGRGPLAHAALTRRVRNVHADLAVAFSQSLPITLLAGTSGAPIRAGFEAARLGRLLLTHRVARLPGPATIEAHLDLVRAVTGGLCAAPCDYRGLVRIAPDSARAADRLLDERGIRPGDCRS